MNTASPSHGKTTKASPSQKSPTSSSQSRKGYLPREASHEHAHPALHRVCVGRRDGCSRSGGAEWRPTLSNHDFAFTTDGAVVLPSLCSEPDWTDEGLYYPEVCGRELPCP